jgi:hypothetical protein
MNINDYVKSLIYLDFYPHIMGKKLKEMEEIDYKTIIDIEGNITKSKIDYGKLLQYSEKVQKVLNEWIDLEDTLKKKEEEFYKKLGEEYKAEKSRILDKEYKKYT